MARKSRILIVDDTSANILILMEILKDQYSVIAARSGEQALVLAAGENTPDLILLDIMMPAMDGYQTLQELKKNPKTRDIPVIFVTSLREDADESKGLDLGAVDFVTKPFNPDIIRLRIRSQLLLKQHRDNLEELVKERTRELEENRLDIIRYLGRAAEYRDNETGNHIIRMSKYSQLIARRQGTLDPDLVLNASPMHDIGKIGIPDRILLKNGPLDPVEWAQMKDHCSIGYNILNNRSSELMVTAAVSALSHHERWDGSGYPEGLKGEDIPLIGRIITIADVFDALISDRPYKKAWDVDRAYGYIGSNTGTHFDPNLVECFFSVYQDILAVVKEYAD